MIRSTSSNQKKTTNIKTLSWHVQKKLFSDADTRIICTCGIHQCGGRLVHCVNATWARQPSVLQRSGVWHLVYHMFCLGSTARYKRGRSYKELRSIFHQWEYPQTAEHDKPYHLVVTSLGLMSGLGWSDGCSDLDGLSHPFCLRFPYCHPCHSPK